MERLLVGPVSLWRRRFHARRGLVGAPPVVARHPPDELVPRVEARGHVPECLREGQVLQFGREIAGQVEARARAQQAVVVVDEAQHPAVDALVVRDVRVGRVRAHGLADDLGGLAARLQQIQQRLPHRQLVAPEDVLSELGEEPVGFPVACCRRRHREPPTTGPIIGASASSPPRRRARLRSDRRARGRSASPAR